MNVKTVTAQKPNGEVVTYRYPSALLVIAIGVVAIFALLALSMIGTDTTSGDGGCMNGDFSSGQSC